MDDIILGRGSGFLESAGGGVMEYPQRKNEGLLEINECYNQFLGIWLYCSSTALGIGFYHVVASLPDIRITWHGQIVLVDLHSLLSHCPPTLLIHPNHSGQGPLLNPTYHNHSCLQRGGGRRLPCLIHPSVLVACNCEMPSNRF